jgi:tetratricopeptide (TPR) repeat protein
MIDYNVDNQDKVQRVLQSLMNTFGSHLELWNTTDGELFLIALTRIPPMYWIESTFDSWMLTKLIQLLCQMNTDASKLLHSLHVMVRDLYRRDYFKFQRLLRDLVEVVSRLSRNPGMSTASMNDISEQDPDLQFHGQYLDLDHPLQATSRALADFLELVALIMEDNPNLDHKSKSKLSVFASNTTNLIHIYSIPKHPLQRTLTSLMVPSARLEAIHCVRLCLIVLEVISFAISNPKCRLDLRTFGPILHHIKSHARDVPMVCHAIKNHVWILYEKMEKTCNKMLEPYVFEIWAELDLNSAEDSKFVWNLINALDLQELANRADRIRQQIHRKLNKDLRTELLGLMSEEVLEILMGSVCCDKRQSLAWRLYLLFYPTEDLEEQMQLKSFFKFIINCLPGRMLDLGTEGCVCLVENLAVLCLMASYCQVIQHMDSSMQNHCGTLLCLSAAAHSDPISDEDKDWQKLLVHIHHLQLYTILWNNPLLLKAIRILPSNRFTFYYFAYVTDQLKGKPSLELWRNASLLLQNLWNKHQSLEVFCKYVASMNLSSKELFATVLQLTGYMNCIESQSYQIELKIQFCARLDVFEFHLSCHVCESHEIPSLETVHVFRLFKQLLRNPYAKECTEIAEVSFRRILMHDFESCTFEMVNEFATLPEMKKIMGFAPILRPCLPPHRLTQNWLKLEPILRKLLIENSVSSIQALGSILVVSIPSPTIFFNVTKLLIEFACEANQLLRSLAIRQLIRLPEEEYGAILRELSIWATDRLDDTPKVLQTISQILKRSPAELLELSWPYTLPVLVANRKLSILHKVCTKGKESDEIHTVKRLIHYSGDIIAHLLVYGPSGSIDYFLQLIEIATSGNQLSLESLFKTNQLQLVRNLIVECGDEDELVGRKALESLKLVASTLNSTIDFGLTNNISKFLGQYALGILTKLQTIFVPSPLKSSIMFKKKVIRGLAFMVRIMGKDISTISMQLLGFLQTITEDKEMLDVTLDLWCRIVHSLSQESLQELFIVISLNLLEVERNNTTEPILLNIFDYLTKVNYPMFAPQIRQISSRIPDTGPWKPIKVHVERLNAADTFQSQLIDILELIAHENNTVVLNSLQRLEEILQKNQLEILERLMGDAVDKLLRTIIQKLCIIVHKHNRVESEIGLAACRCLGIIGAVDPTKLDLSIRIHSMFGPQVDLSHFEGALNFVCSLIEHYLAPSFKATQDSNHQALLAYSIQNALAWCGFNREILAGSSRLGAQKIKPTTQSILAGRWKKFPKHIVNTIEPLLDSRYKMPPIERIQLAYPYFPKASSYPAWIRDWSLDLLHKISNDTKRNIFKLCEDVVAASDTNVIHMLLPHLVHNVIISSEEQVVNDIQNEMIHILSSKISVEKQQLALQMVFHIIEHLSKVIRVNRIKMSQKRSRNAPPLNNEVLEQEVVMVERFLARIPHDMLSEASFNCNSFARALLHVEIYIRSKQEANTDDMDPLWNNMQKIYAQLLDADSLEGLSTLITNPSLEQQIIHHEVCGRWPAAQSCYEVLLQQNPQNTSYQLGLLKCLQNMGHYESMITYSNGILASDPSKVNEISPYSITASWKLGDWNSLEQLCKGVSGEVDFETSLGKVLLLMKRRNVSAFATELTNLRKYLIPIVAASTMESYHKAYDSILQLSILQDIEQFHNILQDDGSSFDVKFQRVLTFWQRRLDVMAPNFKAKEAVLNLRRILINVAAEYGRLKPEALDEQRGLLWLQSAKLSRQNNYTQTAYSAILQAKDLVPGPTRIEQSKWYRSQGQHFQAISELRKAVSRDLKTFEKDPDYALLDPDVEKKVTVLHLGYFTIGEMARRNKRNVFSSRVESIQQYVQIISYLGESCIFPWIILLSMFCR